MVDKCFLTDCVTWFIILNNLCPFLIGSLVGMSELLSRYSDPYVIFDKKSAWFYMFLNGIISILGYWIIKYIKGNLAISSIEIYNIIMAGFGSMLIIRSSIASLIVQGKKVEIGFASILQVFLDTTEKLFNRNRAKEILDDMYEIMKGVEFNKAKINLPSICITTFQTISSEDSAKLGEQVENLNKASSGKFNNISSIELGMLLEKYFGKDFLKSAVEIFKKIEKDEAGRVGTKSLDMLIQEFKS